MKKLCIILVLIMSPFIRADLKTNDEIKRYLHENGKQLNIKPEHVPAYQELGICLTDIHKKIPSCKVHEITDIETAKSYLQGENGVACKKAIEKCHKKFHATQQKTKRG